MVKQFFLEVAKQVETGEYFKDAKDWYHTKYNSPVIERSFCIMFSIVAIFITLLTYQIYMSFFPTINVVPVAITIPDTVSTYSVIKRLIPKENSDLYQKEDYDPDNAFQKYFLAQFVKSFENYSNISDRASDNRNIRKNRALVEEFATEKINNIHAYLNSIENPDGYIIQYRNAQRQVAKKPISVILKHIPVEGTPKDTPKDEIIYSNIHNAIIDFNLAETYRNGVEKEIKNSKRRAYLKYQYTNINYNYEIKDFNPLDFKVLSYNSKEMK